MNFVRNMALVAMAVLALTGCRDRSNAKSTASTDAGSTSGNDVGCMGRILPEGGIISVAPYSEGGGAPVIDELLVKPGDWVMKGQEIATLRSRPFLNKAVLSAEAQVALAEARLEKTRAAESEEIAVAKAEIARLQLQHDAAAADYERNKPLYDKDFLSKSQIESLQSRLGESESLLTQAREHLRGISAERPQDIAIAAAQLAAARADLDRARQDASSSTVRSPADARVLQIMAYPGESVGTQGIAELAATGKMQVVAEVYESDISRVHAGQKATITSDLLPHPLAGTVVMIGSEIAGQEPLSAEPSAPADARIFKVRIDVGEQSILAQRINGKVNVVIHQ